MWMSARALPAPAELAGEIRDADPAVVGDCLQLDAPPLLAVAEGRGAAADARAAVRMTLDRVRTQVSRNADLVERLARHPTDHLRARVEDMLRGALVQVNGEVHALGQRRGSPIEVDLDVVVALPTELLLAHAGRGAVVLQHAGLVHRLTVSSADAGRLPRSLDETLAQPASGGAQATRPLGPDGGPPPIETVAIDLAPGDRAVLLGASLEAGLDMAALARALRSGAGDAEGLGGLLESLQAEAAIDDRRPRVVAAVQRGVTGAEHASAGQRMETLRRVELFRWCSDEELVQVAGLALPRAFPRGALLLRQGAKNTTLYLLVEGRVGVNKDGQRIAEVDSGSVFGEMSMLDDPRASATVEALTPVEVLTLDRDSFLAALKADANMAVKVLWSLLLRVSGNLRATSQRLAELTASSQEDALDEAVTVQAGNGGPWVTDSEEER